jgi:hypothetical protein
MIQPVVRTINRLLKPTGFVLGRNAQYPDFDEESLALFQSVRPFTMTSMERMYALRQAVEYVARRNIPGDIVECGVWKGGSMMVVAKTLMELGHSRRLHLFDTFEGMSAPTDADRDCQGRPAQDCLKNDDRESNLYWAYGPLDQVKQNMRSTGYDEGHIFFVKGQVEDTIPEHAPETIALLRLDTDWYDSTRHELIHLYPRLSPGGVLIIDDYGHWQGARRAVDEYFHDPTTRPLLHRIDYTGRICVKTADS